MNPAAPTPRTHRRPTAAAPRLMEMGPLRPIIQTHSDLHCAESQVEPRLSPINTAYSELFGLDPAYSDHS